MKKFICALLMTLSCYSHATIPEPYRSTVDLPFDGQGWFLNAEPLKWIIAAKKPKVVIEVGSWLGTSTRFIASSLPEGGVVYAVDTWLGSIEPIHQLDPRLPCLYQLFLSNVKHAGLTHRIIPIRMASLEAASGLNVVADLIYIDGEHDTKSVREDILAWWHHVKPNGIMCGDDWDYKPVQEVVIECAQLLNKKLYNTGNFWWYE